MRHGLLMEENVGYVGLDRVEQRRYFPTLDVRDRVTVATKSYYFVGYMTSIIKFLMKRQERRMEIGRAHLKDYPNATIMIETNALMKSGSKQLIGHIRSSVFGALGTNSTVATMMSPPSGATAPIDWMRSAQGMALDVGTIEDRFGVTDMVADASTKPSKPSKLDSFIDKQLNTKVEVKVGTHFNNASYRVAKVIDTGVTEISCSQLAAFLQGRAPVAGGS